MLFGGFAERQRHIGLVHPLYSHQSSPNPLPTVPNLTTPTWLMTCPPNVRSLLVMSVIITIGNDVTSESCHWNSNHGLVQCRQLNIQKLLSNCSLLCLVYFYWYFYRKRFLKQTDFWMRYICRFKRNKDTNSLQFENVQKHNEAGATCAAWHMIIKWMHRKVYDDYTAVLH